MSYGTHITIGEALLVVGASFLVILGYIFIQTLIEHLKSK
jgi:hypothetical protein